MTGPKIALAGSYHAAPEGATDLGDVDPQAPITIVVHVKRRTPDQYQPGSAGDLARLSRPMTWETLAGERRRTHTRAVKRITDMAIDHGLTIGRVDVVDRTVTLQGTARQMTEIFGVTLRTYDDGQHKFRARVGQLLVPAEIAPFTRAVLGFDQRPLSVPVDRLQSFAGAAGPGLWPTDIAALYGIPLDRDVSSVCVGIVALGGGYLDSDLVQALGAMKRDPPAIVDVPTDGNSFGGGTSMADQEIALDLQVLASLLPKARIAVYFADNSIDSLTDTIRQAVFDKVNRPQVVSVSWGSAEKFWTPDERDAMQAVLADAKRLHVSVLFAAGDELATSGLSDGKVHVWFPASSPYALACGGTQPTLAADNASIATETVWHQGLSGTGGGISDVFPVPDYQTGLALPASLNDGVVRRGVPDVACAAAANPGYRIVVNGNETVKDGTSAATPLWAALIAMANAQRGAPLGFANAALYANRALFRPIVEGNNKFNGRGYDAGPNWNACTGLGVPKGSDIIAALAATPVA
jgi:kumamolisin